MSIKYNNRSIFSFAFHFSFQLKSFAIVYRAHSGTIVNNLRKRDVQNVLPEATYLSSFYNKETSCLYGYGYIVHCKKNRFDT